MPDNDAYADWREIQGAFDDYKASLGPYQPDVIKYLPVEYPASNRSRRNRSDDWPSLTTAQFGQSSWLKKSLQRYRSTSGR